VGTDHVQAMKKKYVSVILKLNAMLAVVASGMVGIATLAFFALPEAQRGWFTAAAAGIVALVLVLAVLLRLTIRQGILRSIRAASHVIGRVAEGDLTARVEIQAQGETQKMLDGLDRMTGDLANLVGEVARSASTVAGSSAQIAQGHRDLAWRTEHQASTLEETASSMEELTSTVTLNADNARQASELARGAADTASRGGKVVTDMVRTMRDISTAAGRIHEISSVIDGIAFQTNLLALNAAVEAARAGEQGRGFAVVAAEVRTLAQRSAEAAREIKALIGDSVAKVETGSRMAGAAGDTMQEIVDAIHKVSELIAEIAAASREQSAGIGQVNTAVTELEQGVQQNAAMVQEGTDATHALHEQAQVLLQLVSRFRLGQAETAVAPIRTRPALPAAATSPQAKSLARKAGRFAPR
jgi:methyl-accepting chemotaxis protein